MKKAKKVVIWVAVWVAAVMAYGVWQDINGTVPYTSRAYVAPTK